MNLQNAGTVNVALTCSKYDVELLVHVCNESVQEQYHPNFITAVTRFTPRRIKECIHKIVLSSENVKKDEVCKIMLTQTDIHLLRNILSFVKLEMGEGKIKEKTAFPISDINKAYAYFYLWDRLNVKMENVIFPNQKKRGIKRAL